MTWRQEQAQKEYKEVGLPHFEKYIQLRLRLSDWAEQNKAMLEDRQKESNGKVESN